MYPIIRRRIAVLAVLTMLGGSVGVAPAAVTTFTNEADFLLAIASLVNPATDDLEVGVATGTRLRSGDSLNGTIVTFLIEDAPGDVLDLLITDLFDTTSPDNSLGLDVPDEALLDGETFDLTTAG